MKLDSQTSVGRPQNKISRTLSAASPKFLKLNWFWISRKDLEVMELKLGLAYVKLEDEASLQEALKEVERTHMDRKIKIVRAKPLAEKQ